MNAFRVTLTLAVIGEISVLLNAAILMSGVPIGTPTLTVTGKAMVTELPWFRLRSLTRVGNVPTMPELATTGPAKVRPAGKVSETTP